MKITNPHVKKLLEHYKEISLLGKVKGILDWDLNVNLPEKASEGRSRQTAYLSELQTRLWADKKFRKILRRASKSHFAKASRDAAIVRNIAYFGKYYFNVPAEIIIEKDKVTSQAFTHWKKAKETNNFNEFLPSFKEIVRLNQIIAKHIGYKENPYDALLDEFEPGLTAKETAEVFSDLKKGLVALLKKIQSQQQYDISPFISTKHHYDISTQKKLALFTMENMQFDFQAGRLDESPHPFTLALDRYDVRLTTKYHTDDFRDAFSSTMHETGHALYELGINPEYDATPLEYGVSYAIHECMSRFWENMVGKNPHFLIYMTPFFKENFPEQLKNATEADIIRLFNTVTPSFVRIEADEVTYSLHIILRFEMENGLMNGEITPEDAPSAWKEKSKELFGITPPTDTEGILQDVHWAYGQFGYFPSYALGNLYGAQFLHAMKKDLQFDKDLKKGELRNILSWCNTNIHTHGSLYWPKELIKRVTGEPLSATYFLQYLEEKYSKIYSL